MNWEQLQTFHALVMQGSIIGSARALSIHPTTVSRRLAELEKQVGTRLLKRHGSNYIPTLDGEAVFKIAESMADQARQFENLREGLNEEIIGTVRITTIESFVISCMLPHMPALRKAYPRLNLEFNISDLNLSFTRRETDLAIRFTKPSLMNTVSRKLGDVGFALYGSRDHKQQNPEIASEELDWVGYEDEYNFLPESRWLLKSMKKNEPIIKSTNAGVLKKAIQVGLGVGVLPCYRGDSDASLIRLSGPDTVVDREAWLLMHDDYRSNPRTLSVIDWIVDIFKQDKTLISGRP